MNKLFTYFKKNGFKKTLVRCYEVGIDKVILQIILIFTRKSPLLDVIIIESHNDFDTNGGAFYDYLIREGYNKKYRIIWLLKHKNHKKLPENVRGFLLHRPNVFKDYYFCRAKYLLFDDEMKDKVRKDQISVYCKHSGVTLKNVRGVLVIRESVDYVLSPSKNYDAIEAQNQRLNNNKTKPVDIGLPINDVILKSDKSELKKITDGEYKKVFLWMPTFRQNKARIDSHVDMPFGIPLIYKEEQLSKLNDLMVELESLMIIKLHPMQVLDYIQETNLSNIIFLDGDKVKEKDIDNYRLMPCADAMISDYSSVAFSFLLLDRPICFVLSDIEDYSRGFIVKNWKELLPGEQVFNYEQFTRFLKDVVNERDGYKTKRREMLDYFYEYQDAGACKRFAEFLKL